MQQEKKLVLLEQLRMHLDGKRIVLGGLDDSLRQNFVQDLNYLAGYGSVQFQVCERLEAVEEEDYVLLFNQITVPSDTGKADESGGFDALSELMRQIEYLKEQHPKSVVLVTDQEIYGKRFGPMKLCREEEMGYISHTVQIQLQYMRMAEYLACRCAREERLALKVVRACKGQSGESLVHMILAALRVLVWGTDGEIYNLPSSEENEGMAEEGSVLAWKEERSPLSPMPLKTDCSKEERNVTA